MKDPGCHCETSNPSGSCCLGSVTKGIQIAKEELGMNETSVTPAKSSTGRGEKIAKIGTVVSAIMASACCWLPLLLLAVGVSGVGIAATLEAYRPLLIVVTFGFLGAAFYFTYRPRKTAEASHGCCATEPAQGEACCDPTGKRRLNMMALNKVMLWVVTVLAVAFLFFPSYVGILFGTANNAVVTENMNRAVFQIEGMTCEGCATTVAQAIRQVPGVLAVEVSYEKRQVVVGTEICCPVPKDKILAALKKAGYGGEIIERGKTSNDGAKWMNTSTRASRTSLRLAT
jgi:copper chaperone CopZ